MNHQDEQIVCADCGASFTFSRAEAAFYAERNLAFPPKRCKACRAARKDRGPGGGARAGGPRGDGPPRDRRSGGRPHQPRYTGDVNEYRSPMQDSVYFPPPAWGRGDARAGGGRIPQRDDGNYRAPAFGGDAPRRGAVGRGAPGRGAPARGGQVRDLSASPQRDAGRSSQRAAPREPQRDAAAGEPRSQPRAAKPRAHGEMFDITCKTCGGVAQVPFKPIEGRDVFCQPCYRARKPLRAAGDPT